MESTELKMRMSGGTAVCLGSRCTPREGDTPLRVHNCSDHCIGNLSVPPQGGSRGSVFTADSNHLSGGVPLPLTLLSNSKNWARVSDR